MMWLLQAMLCRVGFHDWAYLEPAFPRVVTRGRIRYPRRCRNCMKEVLG